MLFTSCPFCNNTVVNEPCSNINISNGISDNDRIKLIDIITMVMLGFDISGIFISISIIGLILCVKSLKTSYGFLCLFQSIADLILLINILLFEITYRLDTILLFKTNLCSHPFFLFYWTCNFPYIFNDTCLNLLNGSFCLSQLTGFINFTIKSLIVFIRFLKAGTRFVAMYYPIHYQIYLTKRNTFYVVGAAFLLNFIVHLPFLIDRLNCRIDFEPDGFNYKTICASSYNNIGTIIELITYAICLAFDIACLIKLKKMSKNSSSFTDETKNKRHRILIIQNLANLSAIICSSIPYMLYALSTCTANYKWNEISGMFGNDELWNRTFLTNEMTIILVEISRNSLRRIVGHVIDETFTLFLQGRLAQINEDDNYVQVTSRLPHPQNLNQQKWANKIAPLLAIRNIPRQNNDIDNNNNNNNNNNQTRLSIPNNIRRLSIIEQGDENSLNVPSQDRRGSSSGVQILLNDRPM